MLIYLFYQVLNSVEFILQVQIAICAIVVSMSIPFLKPFHFYFCSMWVPLSGWSGICMVVLSFSSVLKVCGLLFWIISMYVKLAGERRSS